MTSKLTITRERMQEIAEDGFLKHGESKELARMALSAMDCEPVAYIDKQWTLVYYVPPMSMGLKIGDKLYRHAQPAPVVPEEATTENIQVISGALIPRNGGWYKMDENECHMAVDVWNACRAAMLQAGNSPVIPDGYRLQPISEYEAMCVTVNSDEWPQRWIPVSERMPEDRTQVILWDAEIGEVTSGHYSHKTHTFYHCGDAIQNEITHWMPLPAAPQEVPDGQR